MLTASTNSTGHTVSGKGEKQLYRKKITWNDVYNVKRCKTVEHKIFESKIYNINKHLVLSLTVNLYSVSNFWKAGHHEI